MYRFKATIYFLKSFFDNKRYIFEVMYMLPSYLVSIKCMMNFIIESVDRLSSGGSELNGPRKTQNQTNKQKPKTKNKNKLNRQLTIRQKKAT